MGDRASVDWPSIKGFLDSLTVEKEYFHFTEQKLQHAEMLEPFFDTGSLKGLAGIYRMYGLPTFFIVVADGFQGKGVGRQLMQGLDRQVQDTKAYPAIILTVHGNNKRAIRMYEHQGYLLLGAISDVLYMIKPYSYAGHLLQMLLKTAFPFIRLLRRYKHIH